MKYARAVFMRAVLGKPRACIRTIQLPSVLFAFVESLIRSPVMRNVELQSTSL